VVSGQLTYSAENGSDETNEQSVSCRVQIAVNGTKLITRRGSGGGGEPKNKSASKSPRGTDGARGWRRGL